MRVLRYKIFRDPYKNPHHCSTTVFLCFRRFIPALQEARETAILILFSFGKTL